MEKSSTPSVDLKKTRINWHIVLMATSMFMTGASGMVVEFVLSTVSSYLNGSHVEAFSLTIAIMMGMMGLGGWAQKFVSDKDIIDKFVYLEIALAVVGALAPIIVYAAFSFAPNHFQFVYYLFVMAIGFMIGFEIPFITRANAKFTKKLSDNLSIIFACEYIGALIGAFIWVYLLLPYMHLIQIGFVLSVLNFGVAILTYLYFRRGTVFKERKWVLVWMAGVAVFLLWSFHQVPGWSKIVEQKMYPDPIVANKKTAYQNLTLTHNPLSNDTRLYINGSTQFSSLDELRYHEALVHIPAAFLVASPTRALVLGGGDGLAVRELKRYPGMEIDLIELDKDMYRWSKEESRMVSLNNNAFADFEEIDVTQYAAVKNALRGGLQDGTHRVFFSDAGNFINAYVQNALAPRYDMIIIDLPDPYNLAINKMYTKQFYQRLNVMLNDAGVIVTQATSPFHAPKAYETIGRTLQAAGYQVTPYRYNIPSFGEWGWWMASKTEKQYKGLKVSTQYFDDPLARATQLFGPHDRPDLDNADVNTLMRPALVRIYNKESWKVE